MSGFRPNELTMYLRPLQVQPYQFINVAKWLVKKRICTDVQSAIKYLQYLMQYQTEWFKFYVSEYYKETDFRSNYVQFKTNPNVPFNQPSQYGEEQHMYFY